MRHPLFIAFAVVATSISGLSVIHAAPIKNSGFFLMFEGKRVKNIKFDLRNETGVPMEVKAGDKIVTLAPGKPVSIVLPEGASVILNTAIKNYEVGSVIAQATSNISGATVVIH